MPGKSKLRVHQFHSGSAVADAVTNSMFFVQSMLRGMGLESEIFVEHVHPALSNRIRALDDLRLSTSDLLLIHHSMGHDALPRLGDLRCRKSLIYHNITPPEFFSEKDPFHTYAIQGYRQLSLLRDIVESAIAVSPFNARQLIEREFSNVTVIPLLKDFLSIRNAQHLRAPYHDDTVMFRLLFVGRIVPHKCQHELIDLVDKVRIVGSKPLGLILTGHFDDTDGYKLYLDELVQRSGLNQSIKIIGQVTDQELFGWYRAASAYVSLSEHEGFGVPLIEAMALDLPVIAYASSAVPDTLGDAGITIPNKDPATILEHLRSLHEDRHLRREVIHSQRRRLLSFRREHIEAQLRNWLVEMGAIEGGDQLFALDDQLDARSSSQRTHYVIEGPFETSYSLAIVNRNLALALNAQDPGAACIEPADGTDAYSVDIIAASRLPANVRSLLHPVSPDAERIVTIRNTYPPRPNGILGDLRLVHLAWEESSIPRALSESMNFHLDGVLVPSEYSKRAIRNSGVRVPISVIGHGIDHSGAVPRVVGDRSKRGRVTPSLPFTFLHISSGLARKGIEELLTAYCMAFSSYDPVLLVIKTFDNATNTINDWIERLTSSSRYSPAIQVVSEELDEGQIDFLYHVADALVLPSRGEGFNLPAAEGMARGLPTLVTRHSGHLDFCNDENSFLIDCTYEISGSHLKIPNSFWARASVERLIEAMKTVYRAGRSPDSVPASRGARGQQDVSGLQWHDVAKRVDNFLEYLRKRPIMTRKLRLAWVSTFNARCGIATYSEHLLEFFDKNSFEITIIADDQETLGPDPENVQRLWKKGGAGLGRAIEYVIANKFDAALLQYNFSFFEVSDFADTLLALVEANINTFLILHRTKDLEDDRLVSHFRVIQALQSCTRVFVHNIEDVNRLRACGLTENVVLLTHGVADRPPLQADAVRSLLGLSAFAPVIGTFGFLLPGKGLAELIHSFALLLRACPAAYLLMLNADYPIAESQQERERCLALVRQLELEGRIRLINEFLDIEETLFLLSACDAIVFPYQRSDESASGAVRLGLAASRPVLTTPLPVFAEMSEIVHHLPGTNAWEIAAGMISFLGDENRRSEVLQRQRDWVKANSWATQADRIGNIVRGCFEETRGVELRAPGQIGSGYTQQRNGEMGEQDGSKRSPEALLATVQKFLVHGTIKGEDGAPWNRADTLDPPSLPTPRALNPVRGAPRFLQRFGSRPHSVSAHHAGTSALSCADRARDSLDWRLAAQLYRKVLDEDPRNSAVWVQYGHALKEAGDVPRAENAYRKSLDLNAGVADTHLQLGHALKLQGKRIEASAAYFRALVLDPALDDAAFELRHLGWSRGRIQLALRREQGSVP